jgi:N-acetylglucosaminyldiphosphoundecaprenol N-acetyl-beta-D-mannosaminyltransferase
VVFSSEVFLGEKVLMAVIDFSSLRYPYSGFGQRRHFLGAPFDCFAQQAVIELIDESEASTNFRYLVTPNVDHVVRLKKHREYYKYYQAAWMSLCDSRPIAVLAQLRSLRLPLVTGSDLTAVLFASVVKNGDLITLIAADDKVVRDMEAAFPTVCFRAMIPPQGVWNDRDALDSCIDFVLLENARFVFIAIGSPQSEKIAYELSLHPDARGLGFCVGASLEFLVGTKKRAPFWMRRISLEWLHRLASDPKRLWRRYVGAVIPLIGLFVEELSARRRPG